MRIKGLPIVRSGAIVPVRAAGDGEDTLGRLFVRFSPFNTPYEINSYWEGRFIEQTLPGAFRKTANEAQRADGTFSTKMLFNHGSDFHIGDKMLAVPDRFEEVEEDGYHGPILEGDLLDTSYNRDLLPGLQRNAYGSSFMFEVIREEWRNEPEASETNPEGLPERDILEVRAFEAGPVTWPASPTASAGMRSRCGTDAWMERLAARGAARHAELVRSYAAFRELHSTPDFRPGTPTPDAEDASRRQVEEAGKRAARLRNYRLELMKRGH